MRNLFRALTPLSRVARSVSFSQYAEDILLAVSLFPRAKGRYVDVGAYHPWRGSNTYKLYLRGWSGITIEPNPTLARQFRKYRPRDIHLAEGVMSEAGELTYWAFPDAKLNTFSEEMAASYKKNGVGAGKTSKIRCRALEAILDEHLAGRSLDLLSIDCEGLDFDVLKSLNVQKYRPTAVLIEDFDAFEKFKSGFGVSRVENFLRSHDFAPIGQALFSTLYIDLRAVAARASSAFNLDWVQFQASQGERFTQAAE